MIAKRTHVDRYETANGETIYRDYQMIPKFIVYSVPARLASEDECPEIKNLNSNQLKIMDTHINKMNGTRDEKAANAKTLDDVIEQKGLVDPTQFPCEFWCHAKVLFGIVNGMKRTMSVWINPKNVLIEYFSNWMLVNAWQELIKRGAIIKREDDECVAIKWAYDIDEQFTNDCKVNFEHNENCVECPTTDEYDIRKHGVKFDARMHKSCVYFADGRIPIIATSKYRRDVGQIDPLYKTEYPEHVEMTQDELISDIFSENPYLRVAILSDHGRAKLIREDLLQVRVNIGFNVFKRDDIIWVERKIFADGNTVRCKSYDGRVADVSLSIVMQRCISMNGVSCEQFIALDCIFDVVVFVYPMKFNHVWYHSNAKIGRVLHVYMIKN